jgi:hypothetical protein
MGKGIESITLRHNGESVTIGRAAAERVQAATANLLGTVELRRREQQRSEPQAEPTFQPPVRDCVLGEPDEIFHRAHAGSLARGDGTYCYLDFAEDNQLAHLADSIIERWENRYAALDKLTIAYLWADSLGNADGEPRFLKLQKVTPLTLWALNRGRLIPFEPHVLVFLNATVADRAQLTNWQAQAAIHTALECIRVEGGKPRLLPPGMSLITNFIARRYGAWSPDLQAIGAALTKAERQQMSLFGFEDEKEEEGDDDGDE